MQLKVQDRLAAQGHWPLWYCLALASCVAAFWADCRLLVFILYLCLKHLSKVHSGLLRKTYMHNICNFCRVHCFAV